MAMRLRVEGLKEISQGAEEIIAHVKAIKDIINKMGFHQVPEAVISFDSDLDDGNQE